MKIHLILILFGFTLVKEVFSDIFKKVGWSHVYHFVASWTAVLQINVGVRRRWGYHFYAPVLFHHFSKLCVLGNYLALSIPDRSATTILLSKFVMLVVLLHVRLVQLCRFLFLLDFSLFRIKNLLLQNCSVRIRLLFLFSQRICRRTTWYFLRAQCFFRITSM